ncbi:MAG: aminopeptidase [Paramuribaculum sp.]|nr:aminopeptidase [Paramuribaculum sp.]
MKHILLAAALAVGLTATAEEAKDSVGFGFKDLKVVKTNGVRDQNKSGTCWCFSSNSFLENEILRKGGEPVDLSEMFVVWHTYDDKADKFIRTNGKTNFSQGGASVDVPYVWAKYGMVPEEVYRGLNYGEDNHVHGEVEAAMQAYLNVINRKPNKHLSTAWRKGLQGILNAYFGELPETFQYKGKTYTPQSFAKSLGLNMDDYVSVTSFTHHPFYQPFAIEVADNWLGAQSYNVPMEEMKAIVDNAIENGYSVAWAADVSEKGFNWKEGFAIIPAEKTEADLEGTELARWVALSAADKEKERYDIKGPVKEVTVTQESRQEGFDRQDTTDDHGMVIVGVAEDVKGNRYYKVQNSWTDNQKYGGFLYVSEPYFLAKTLNIYVNKESIPKEIKNKLGMK